MSLLERLTTLFAPDDCLGCGREGALLCGTCLPRLPALVGRCFGCQRQVKGAGCKTCVNAIGLHALGVATNYSAATKLLVANLKFRGNQSAARLMAQCLAATVLPADAVLVNVPATTAHIRQRGFDQAALVARHLSHLTGRPYSNALRRLGQQHQLGASRERRLLQLSLSLSARSGMVAGKHIVLIDDVLTTGSSLQAAARTLHKAGATQVDALVFAQSIKPPKGK